MLKSIMVTMLLMGGAMQAMAAAPFDQLFMRNEAQGSAYELAIAKLAQTRATRPDVREYASILVNDHEAYNGALRDLAQAKGVALPPDMTAKNQQRLAQLTAAQGAAFDTAFIREAKRINSEDIRDFRREASRTADAEIRAFVTRFLDVDMKHDAGARALSGRTVASGMPVIRPDPSASAMPVVPPPAGSNMPVITPSTPVGR